MKRDPCLGIGDWELVGLKEEGAGSGNRAGWNVAAGAGATGNRDFADGGKGGAFAVRSCDPLEWCGRGRFFAGAQNDRQRGANP